MRNKWAAVVAFVLTFACWPWWGFVAAKLWGWFAVPALGAPPVSVVYAMGLGLLAGMFMPTPDTKDREDGVEILAVVVGRGVLRPAFVLGLGWALGLFA